MRRGADDVVMRTASGGRAAVTVTVYSGDDRDGASGRSSARTNTRPKACGPLEPQGAERVVGGLLGVAYGETWRAGWADDGCDAAPAVAVGPVTAALLDLSVGYAAGCRQRAPLVRAATYGHKSLPAWLIAATIARSVPSQQVNDAVELAVAAGARGRSLAACVTFVEVASALLAGHPASVALAAATVGRSLPSPHGLPDVTGEASIDALEVGLWVLTYPACGIADIVPAVTTLAGPTVAAAVGGLLGLRDGVSAIPTDWRCRLGSAALQCRRLAPRLAHVARLEAIRFGRVPGVRVAAPTTTSRTPQGNKGVLTVTS